MSAKRVLDLVLTIPGLIVLSPFLLVIMILIKLSSPGPVFFCQERVGRYGKIFKIFKFRTMITNAESYGKQITVGDDFRITKIGRILRKYKIDELPQLINVIRGEMSLVGPRPEVPRYVAEYPESLKEVILSIPPGITDYASIEYKEESKLLSLSENPEETYIKDILPIKCNYYIKYVKEKSIWLDLKLIFLTVREIFKIGNS